MQNPLTRAGHALPSADSLRIVIPNAVTFLSLACGLMAIRAAIDGSLELATACILAAVALDGVDGRLARGLNATSIFGAELDSLADCVSFGVAPALVLYYAGLHTLGDAGWIAATCFAAGITFRLARFNAELQDPPPARDNDFFVGVPAPAGATMALLPIMIGFVAGAAVPPSVVAVYLLVVAALCVSRLPVYAGKASLPVSARWIGLAASLVFAAVLMFPWTTLSALSAIFVMTLPAGLVLSKRRASARSV
jgi:CDP-diacylglycerol--serine O-phosphatidyltransferase